MINESKILVTGGSGLLGTEFKNIMPNAMFPSSKEFDITNETLMKKYLDKTNPEIVLHAAAFMPPNAIDKEPNKGIAANIIGTALLTNLCMLEKIKMVYISTDYVFSGEKGNYKETDAVLPPNKYAWSKLGGECAVQMYDNSIIIRTTFGPKVFPYPKAFIDQWTSKETVDIIAEKIYELIKTDTTGIFHIGGPRITRYEYAQSLPNGESVGKLSRNELSYIAPKDNSLNTEKYQKLISSYKEENK